MQAEQAPERRSEEPQCPEVIHTENRKQVVGFCPAIPRNCQRYFSIEEHALQPQLFLQEIAILGSSNCVRITSLQAADTNMQYVV